MSENELGAFLRARREAVTPSEVGLPEGPRRRTPGLRRSELATLSGISVEYLTRLEQGRDRNPSAQVLAALADALRLSGETRLHLGRLLKHTNDHKLLCPAAETPVRQVRPTVQALLDRLDPSPAVLLNRLSEVVACTTGYERLMQPVGLLDGEQPSVLRYVFTDPRAHDTYPDWGRVADAQFGMVGFDLARDDPHVSHLAAELALTAGSEFANRLAAPPKLPVRSGVERFVHPESGELRLAYETLDLPDPDGQRILVHLPGDETTAAALDRLTGRRPGALRAVSG
ncbi:transcriptional regulator [Streptomyces spiroverticillatus]|uniref:Transcriptional regulator n=1 Tax=Streptomyces finlayi TaxID=67296 RepID=A0A918X3F1_9ACTN|nr:helix-turn-helix transcriptional regulator [Streptomyces finlayi]GHA26554.1 transcriptional regulator [Streptomyces spiroverticillatus]GHD08021.1 transcriptional regulator [Streptomyces finlayi]